MAITNRDRIDRALDFLKAGLGPFVERELKATFKDRALAEASRLIGDDRLNAKRPLAEWDAAVLLKLMWDAWNDVFRKTLGPAERSLISELRDHRHKWAHQHAFSSDDAYRVLDSAGRLLTAISSPQAEEIDKMKMELLRVRFDEQVRSEKRKSVGTAIESQAAGTLPPWREIVTPHKDVASGRYQQAEFAADLWQVHLKQGSDEYRDPVEFFRRTFLTESLKRLLAGAVQRLWGKGGDPVIQLQTNFGGGKTHSMLALYHLVSGKPPGELAGIETVMEEAGMAELPKVKRVVLVGNKISPGNPVTKPDGTEVRTLWGELAWQLGGRKAFDRVRADDERATSPGDALRELFNEHGPCLILIDEWVAYARQLHDQSDLPAGSFETQFSFAQVLTESAKLADRCLLVISLPASDTTGSPHTQADDAEVGGQRGREALDRLQNVIGRVESSFRPASAEEGFEIVRRRLFEPLLDQAKWVARDTVARTFYDFYRTQKQEFPPEASSSDYEKRIRAAYPIHPEIFDRLYSDWSTLVKFQRTRGVLRLMAAVIHSLWEKGDRNPLILPANIPIDDPRVQTELTHYLSDNWVPVIEKDVDGPSSLPLQLDSSYTNLGKLAACRRVARTIYLGSAPTAAAAHRGLEDRRIHLGCVMPGEPPAVFGDALRRLAGAATHLYQDGSRYWYSTQPNVTSLAEDRADLLKREPDKVVQELAKRVRADVQKRGDFSGVHSLPSNGQDVADELEARLVVLGSDHPYGKEPNSPAEVAAKAILESRGNAPRLYRNALVFLAMDKTRYKELEEAIRRYLAWESILGDKEALDLSPYQVKQAQTQKGSADGMVTVRLPESYQWLLVPEQNSPQDAVKWQPLRLTGQDNLAVRASKKLRSGDGLLIAFAGTTLRMELDRVPLWRGDHVSVKQLVDDFARYPYLPRLKDPDVLLGAIRDGAGLLSWERDTFAYADSYDEEAGRYRGLRGGQQIILSSPEGLLVKSDVARKQLEAERAKTTGGGAERGEGEFLPPGRDLEPKPVPPRQKVLRRFHGTVGLDPARVGRDASHIAEEVIAHLAGLMGAKVKVTLEIDAETPNGTPDNVVRTVTENSRTLKFSSHGFEEE